MDFQTLLFNPIYSVQGVSASLTLAGASSSIDGLTILDKTAGVDVGDGDVNVQTILPAAVLRVVELTENGVSVDQLPKAIVEFNNSRWRVKSYRPKPTLKGERDGEVYLFLEELPFVEEDDSETESETATESEVATESET